MKKAVVVFSGGVDSSTLLYHMKEKGCECYALTFDYGQRHSKEIKSAQKIAELSEIKEHKIIDLSTIKSLLDSALTRDDVEIPKGEYEKSNMDVTVVPNRNLLFLTLAHAWAQSLKADVVAYAAHAGDHFLYPDCRKVFVDSTRVTLFLSSEKNIEILAPFWDWKKSDIVKEGLRLKVPYQHTWSCYEGRKKPCGLCGTCIERIAAFKSNNVRDPLEYEEVE